MRRFAPATFTLLAVASVQAAVIPSAIPMAKPPATPETKATAPATPAAPAQPAAKPAPAMLSSKLNDAPAITAAAMLRVMSFNLRVATIFDIQNHWEFRKAKAVAAIRNFNPDILGTQECENVHADYLKASLPDYGFVGVGRNDGKTSGEMCGLFYKKQTLEKLAEGHFWLSKTPQVPGSKSFGSWFTRMCTWVKLKHTQTGQIIFAFDTHLDSNSSNAREKQAELLRQKIQEIAGDAPVVLTGDFNTGDLSAPYTQLVGPHSGIALTLTDAFRATHTARGKQEGSFHGFHGGKSGERIDWILASSALLPVSAAIDYASCANGYVSDHYPVNAVFTIKAPDTAAQPATKPPTKAAAATASITGS